MYKMRRQTSGLGVRPGCLMLDYLRACLDDEPETWEGLNRWLGYRDERRHGWHQHYNHSADVLDGGLVAWCSERERAEIQGVLVDLPGRACACLGERLVPFLEWCLDHGHMTRADFAIDDYEKRFTYERMKDIVASGAIVSRWRKWQFLETGRLLSGERRGWTLYLGSRNSEAMVRIYDKAGEQGVKGPWVRFEMEYKKDTADAACRAYLREGSEVVKDQIARSMRFVMPIASDSNRARWPVASWWREFIGSARPEPTLVEGVEA